MSDYYNSGSAPSNGSFGSSAVMRAEFDAIESGISDKLPALAGAANKVVVINPSGTALIAVTLDKTTVGLANVDNTSDVNKPVSTATTAAIAASSAAILTNPTHTEQTLTDAATTAWNMDSGHIAKWTITATGRTLGLPTNIKVGGQYQLLIKLNTPATMTPAFNAVFKFPYDVVPDFTTSSFTMFTLAWSTEHGKLLVFPAPGF